MPQPAVPVPRRPDPPAAAAPEQVNRYDAVIAFLARAEAGACFAALPALAADGSLRIEAFGPEDAALKAFSDALEAEVGALPEMVLRPVAPGQCPALDFVRAAPDYPAFALYFDLARREVASGALLEGSIGPAEPAGTATHLLIVDDDGLVQRLDPRLARGAGGALAFSVPVTLTDDAPETEAEVLARQLAAQLGAAAPAPPTTMQLLIALRGEAPLGAVTGLPDEGAPAAEIFARIGAETAARGIFPQLSVIAFSVR
ncbi:MAG: hypothetical protein H5U20_12305 [Rhodobacteraceae bacterium]|nr:hypothetical protein [Paracoccaceae bacterium]